MSRWENGNNMPDLSIMVELADRNYIKKFYYSYKVKKLIPKVSSTVEVTLGINYIDIKCFC